MLGKNIRSKNCTSTWDTIISNCNIFFVIIVGQSKNRTTIPAAISDTTYLNGTGLRKSQIVLHSVDRTMYKSSILCITELPYYFIVNNTIDLDVNREYEGVFIRCDNLSYFHITIVGN